MKISICFSSAEKLFVILSFQSLITFIYTHMYDEYACTCICWFVARGADVRAVNANGCTPLHDAVKRGDAQAVTELLMHNSDPMAKVTCGLVMLFSSTHLLIGLL